MNSAAAACLVLRPVSGRCRCPSIVRLSFLWWATCAAVLRGGRAFFRGAGA